MNLRINPKKIRTENGGIKRMKIDPRTINFEDQDDESIELLEEKIEHEDEINEERKKDQRDTKQTFRRKGTYRK